MLDFGFSEILLTSAIALVVLGPERLPKVARQVGNWMGRARLMARQLSEQLEREVSADELLKEQTRTAKTVVPDRSARPAVAPPPTVAVPPIMGSAPLEPSAATGPPHAPEAAPLPYAPQAPYAPPEVPYTQQASYVPQSPSPPDAQAESAPSTVSLSPPGAPTSHPPNE